MIEPEVGKTYLVRRSGKTRTVRVLSVKAAYRDSRFGLGRNKHWICLDLETRRTVEMKAAANFRLEVNSL